MKRIRDLDAAGLRALGSITKYPAIETFHAMGDRGRLTEEHVLPPGPVIVTEKVHGTNAGVVLFGDEFLIRAREEWLTYTTDVIRNPSNGVVEASLPVADKLLREWPPEPGDLVVVFGEVYGGRINEAKAYTAQGALGFRMFDWFKLEATQLDDLLAAPLEEIAGWRDDGGQPFEHEPALRGLSEVTGIPLTPRLCGWLLEEPSTVAVMQEQLSSTVDKTHCAIDGEAGQAEGVVIRTEDRKYIRKLRFEDYRRTLLKKR